jgi:hypothetical protein
MIAVVGGFTASNYGDQLYPTIIEGLLRRCGIDEQINFYSPLPGSSMNARTIRSTTSLRTDQPRAVLVGGGDLIRADARNIALDHLNIHTSRRSRPAARLRAQRLVRRRFGSGTGPWLPTDTWTAKRVPLMWVSVGVHNLPDTPSTDVAMRQVTAAWIRTRKGIERAVSAGLATEDTMLGPDAIFSVAQLADPRWRDIGASAVRKVTGLDSHEVVVVHAAPFTGWTTERLTAVLAQLTDLPVVFMPMGRYAREDKELAEAAKQLGRKSLGVLPPDVITGVLSAAGSVVTTSMHAAIVAGCFGRPVVVPGTEKTLQAFEACPEPPPLINAPVDALVDTVRAVHGSPSARLSDANTVKILETLRWVLGRGGVI